jgi:hypothetical protein
LLAFDLERGYLLDTNGVPHEALRLAADQNLARARRLLEPLGDVNGVAGHEPLTGCGVARDDLAGVDAEADLEPDPQSALELVVQALELVSHLDGCRNRTKRIIFVHRRNAEHGHDRVADELLHRAAVPLDHGAHLIEVAPHGAAKRFRIEALAQCGGARDVGEDDRDDLSHLAPGHFFFCQAGSAGQAETGGSGILLSTARADRHVLLPVRRRCRRYLSH